MRRTAVIIAGFVVTALTTAAVVAVSGEAEAPAATTIRLVTKDCTRKLIDVAPRMRGFSDGPGAGDGLAGSCPAFDRAGKRAGAFDYTCSFAKGGRRARVLCTSVYTLAGGDLYVLARPDGEKEAGSGPIVGGTRAYAGARGTFTSVERPGASESNGVPKDDTITLLP